MTEEQKNKIHYQIALECECDYVDGYPFHKLHVFARCGVVQMTGSLPTIHDKWKAMEFEPAHYVGWLYLKDKERKSIWGFFGTDKLWLRRQFIKHDPDGKCELLVPSELLEHLDGADEQRMWTLMTCITGRMTLLGAWRWLPYGRLHVLDNWQDHTLKLMERSVIPYDPTKGYEPDKVLCKFKVQI